MDLARMNRERAHVGRAGKATRQLRFGNRISREVFCCSAQRQKRRVRDAILIQVNKSYGCVIECSSMGERRSIEPG